MSALDMNYLTHTLEHHLARGRHVCARAALIAELTRIAGAVELVWIAMSRSRSKGRSS